MAVEHPGIPRIDLQHLPDYDEAKSLGSQRADAVVERIDLLITATGAEGAILFVWHVNLLDSG
jgi:hypothetical protein